MDFHQQDKERKTSIMKNKKLWNKHAEMKQ